MRQPRQGRRPRGRAIGLQQQQQITTRPAETIEAAELSVVRIVDNPRRQQVTAQVRGAGRVVVIDNDEYGRDWTYEDVDRAVKEHFGVE